MCGGRDCLVEFKKKLNKNKVKNKKGGRDIDEKKRPSI